MQLDPPVVRHYFVDEAGDGVLFSGGGRLIVGENGCSSHFLLGKADIDNPDSLALALNDLRHRLLADPYFRGVPSMQPAQRKTALAFHAKDDVAEVRREVFALLLQHEVRFYAVVRSKLTIAKKVLEFNKRKPAYRYHQNQLYDRCVSRLFKERLHKHDGYTIHFAKRGRSDRTDALQRALESARHNFRRTWGINRPVPIEIIASRPVDVTCLQAVDYFLWALQRTYAMGEDRFIQLLWPKVGLVHDIDDTRSAEYGVYYNQSKPLTSAARAKEKLGDIGPQSDHTA